MVHPYARGRRFIGQYDGVSGGGSEHGGYGCVEGSRPDDDNAHRVLVLNIHLIDCSHTEARLIHINEISRDDLGRAFDNASDACQPLIDKVQFELTIHSKCGVFASGLPWGINIDDAVRALPGSGHHALKCVMPYDLTLLIM